MLRKQLLVFAAVGGALLVFAGVAAACVELLGAQAAAATFDAQTVDKLSSNSCTAPNGDTLVWTEASYTGNASSSNAQLDGPLAIYAHSVVDTTTGVGYVEGRFEVGPDGSTNDGHFVAALSGSGAAGFSEAELQSPDGRLMASFSSTFDPQTGFSNGSLGTGNANGAGVILSNDQGCSPSTNPGDGDNSDQGSGTDNGSNDQGNSSSGGQSQTGNSGTNTTQTLGSHSHSGHSHHHGGAHKHPGGHHRH